MALNKLTAKLPFIILILGSILLNIILLNKTVFFYKAINLLRLDPLETKSLNDIPDGVIAEKDRPVILLFGDSRIAHWRPALSLPGCTLINRGIDGQTTQQLILRLERDVLAYEPDVVILQAGINDLKTIGLFPNRKSEIIAFCKENLSKITERISAKRITTVVLTIFPQGKPGPLRFLFWSAEINAAISEINNSLKAIQDENIHIVDADIILRQGNYIQPQYKKNMLHLNQKGYEKLNKSLQPYLKDLLTSQSGSAPKP